MPVLFRPLVTSPVSPLQATPLSVRAMFSEYKHDTLEFQVPSVHLSVASPYAPGTPVKVQWTGKGGGTFHGYIDSLRHPFRIPETASGIHYMTVCCTGMSYHLKEEAYATYLETRAEVVVSDVAQRFHLGSFVSTSEAVWPALLQRGMSWWAFICHTAKRVGYSLYMRDATIFAVDRRRALSEATSVVEYNVLGSTSSGGRNALEFTPEGSASGGLLQEEKPGVYFAKGTSSFSGRDFEVTNATPTAASSIFNPRFKRAVDKNPRTIEEAQTYLSAAQAMNLFTQRARLVVNGNSLIRAGTAIQINTGSTTPAYEGRWFVLDAKHTLTRDHYVTEIDMGKDRADSSVAPPKAKIPIQTRPLPPVQYRDNRWAAAWSTL